MKNFIIRVLVVLAFTAIGTVSHAQDFAGLVKGPTTHTNSQNDTTLFTINKGRTSITFKYDIAKTSGTVAGTIVTQYKLTADAGEQWFTLYTDSITDATATYVHNLSNNPGVYYRIIDATTGTSVSVHNKYVLFRQFYPLQ
jgi:hypothetical protein